MVPLLFGRVQASIYHGLLWVNNLRNAIRWERARRSSEIAIRRASSVPADKSEDESRRPPFALRLSAPSHLSDFAAGTNTSPHPGVDVAPVVVMATESAHIPCDIVNFSVATGYRVSWDLRLYSHCSVLRPAPRRGSGTFDDRMFPKRILWAIRKFW